MADQWAFEEMSGFLEHIQAFHVSVLKQMRSHIVAGEKNMIIFNATEDHQEQPTVEMKIWKSFMFFHSFNKYRGQSLGGYIFFDANEFTSVGALWTKALCIHLLHGSFPNFVIFHVASDVVMFDQFFADVQLSVKPPCIASATEYAGMHTAGGYCVYPQEVTPMCCEPEVEGEENFGSDVMIHQGRVQDFRAHPDESRIVIALSHKEVH